MATALWVRTIKHHRMDLQNVQPCTRDDPQRPSRMPAMRWICPSPCGCPRTSGSGRSSGRRGSFPTRSWSMWTLTAWKSNTLTPTPKAPQPRSPQRLRRRFLPAVQHKGSAVKMRQSLSVSPKWFSHFVRKANRSTKGARIYMKMVL